MTTARFTVTLYVEEAPRARVSRALRKADLDRAVFYAQMWLLRTQCLIDYCGISYTNWQVTSKDDDGNDVELGNGNVENAKLARLFSPPKERRNSVGKKRPNGKTGSKQTARSTDTENQHQGIGKTARKKRPTTTQTVRELTYFQRRIQEMRDRAKQKLASQ